VVGQRPKRPALATVPGQPRHGSTASALSWMVNPFPQFNARREVLTHEARTWVPGSPEASVPCATCAAASIPCDCRARSDGCRGCAEGGGSRGDQPPKRRWPAYSTLLLPAGLGPSGGVGDQCTPYTTSAAALELRAMAGAPSTTGSRTATCGRRHGKTTHQRARSMERCSLAPSSGT
jgi:hypothetical protein